jgi:hypothetical protein
MNAATDAKRAGEILAMLLRQKRDLAEGGTLPVRVVLSPADYRLLQRYHAGLGMLPDMNQDYITRYSVLGLPVHIAEKTLGFLQDEKITRED